jgi:hypoxanthine phosphoribosyltransferase
MTNDIAYTLISKEQIEQKVAELGSRISKDYEGRNLLLLGLLKGAVVFMSDLMRSITIPPPSSLWRCRATAAPPRPPAS